MPVTNVTLLENLINPQVMGDMISAELINKLVATGLFTVNTKLVGVPGNTITVPTYQYIGAATDLAENTEGDTTTMTATDKEYTVKKAVKNVALTDESVLSGYGDPMGQALLQLRMSIQDKVENDSIAELSGIPDAPGGLVYTDAAAISYATVVEALELLKLEDMPTDLFLLVSRSLAKTMKLDTKFVDRFTAFGDNIIQTGVIGTVAGCKVVVSNRIPDTDATAPRGFIVPMGRITAFLKRDVAVEQARDILFKRTIVSVDQHYVVAIEDYTKLCAIVTSDA